jgi:hypothetical protein
MGNVHQFQKDTIERLEAHSEQTESPGKVVKSMI